MILQPSPVAGSITKVRHCIADNEAGCAAGSAATTIGAFPRRRFFAREEDTESVSDVWRGGGAIDNRGGKRISGRKD